MNKFFNNLSAMIEKYLTPIAGKLAQNKYLQTLSTAFMNTLPIIMIGSFALILSEPFLDYTTMKETELFYNFFKGWSNLSVIIGPHLDFLFSATLGSQSIYITLSIAYTSAIKNKLNIFHTMIVAFISFIVVNSTFVGWDWSAAYFGGTGLFSAILTAFIAVEMYRWLVEKKVGYIKMPPAVPPSLKESIGLLAPIALILIGATVVRAFLAIGFDTSLPELMMSIGTPLNMAVDSILGISIASTFSQIGWWFGIHSSAILSVVMPSFDANLLQNATDFSRGIPFDQLQRIVTGPFYFNFVAIGGGGATFGLVLMMIRSKSQQIKTVGRLALVPGIFGINEPVLFGLPIVLNPIFLIPFLLSHVVNIVVCYATMQLGFINKTIIEVSSTAPIGIGPMLSNLDWRSLVLTGALIFLDILVYYPFFKMFEKQKLVEEMEEMEVIEG